MVGYRNGYNGVDLKSIVSLNMRPAGSNPAPTAKCLFSIMVITEPW